MNNDENLLNRVIAARRKIFACKVAAIFAAVVLVVSMMVTVVSVAGAKRAAEEAANSNSNEVASNISESPDEELARRYLRYAIEGPGHIEAVRNCFIDENNNFISVGNMNHSARIRLVPDAPGYIADVSMEGGEFVRDGDIVSVGSHEPSSVCRITFLPDPNAQPVVQQEPQSAPDSVIQPESQQVAQPESQPVQ